MRLITRCSDVEGTQRLLINLGALDILLKLIPPCFKHAEGYGADLMRTLANILAAASAEEKNDVVRSTAMNRAAKGCEIPNFKGSYLGRFPLVSADFWSSDHLSERSRSVDAFSGTRARGTLTLKRR